MCRCLNAAVQEADEDDASSEDEFEEISEMVIMFNINHLLSRCATKKIPGDQKVTKLLWDVNFQVPALASNFWSQTDPLSGDHVYMIHCFLNS